MVCCRTVMSQNERVRTYPSDSERRLPSGRTQAALETIDWDFPSAPPSSGVHGIHPYPAKFIPEIPRHLIELFSAQCSSGLLDPFCGSGTTLVEAIDLGFDAWGVDLNPLACLIARVKTTPLRVPLEPLALQIISHARSSMKDPSLEIPMIPHLDHWFEREIQQALTAILRGIEEVEDIVVSEALKVAFSSIVVQVSNQESDTRYAAVNKGITSAEVFSRFEKAVRTIDQSLSQFRDNLFRNKGRAVVLNQDILGVMPSQFPERIGLVITSPPYPNAYEYWLYHKYRMYWLGMNPLPVREREIGARPHYFKRRPYDEKTFEHQMHVFFALLSKIMIAAGKVCMLIGRSIIHGKTIDNVALMERASAAHGFVIDGLIKRRIATSRKSFNLSHGKINDEHLIVFTHGGDSGC